MNQLESRLTAVISKQFPRVVGRRTDGATFDQVDMDSLHVVGFPMTLQREFGVRLSGDDPDIDADFADVVGLLAAKGVPVEPEES
jgi:acyl carrier protein